MKTRRIVRSAILAISCGIAAPTIGHAQQPRTPTGRPAPPALPAPSPAAGLSTPGNAAVPSTPQQTTASFADWTLRCSRLGPAPGTQFCEIAQGVQREDRLVAQMAIGRPAKGQALHLTILVPVNVSFGAAPALLPPRETGAAGLELTWRRCIPAGCTADIALSEEIVQRVRSWSEPARIGLMDATGQTVALPFSPRGLPQALDALAKEEGG